MPRSAPPWPPEPPVALPPARTVHVPGRGGHARDYNPPLLDAIASVTPERGVKAA
jgi:hypothetical protein